MAITAAVCDSFVKELLEMTPHTSSDTYKIALYQASASLSRSTTAYTATGEVANSGDYVAGGQSLVGFTVGQSGSNTWIDWTTDPMWTGVTFSTAGALIYNATRSNKACAVLSFGQTLSPSGVPFVIALPAAGANAAIHVSNP